MQESAAYKRSAPQNRQRCAPARDGISVMATEVLRGGARPTSSMGYPLRPRLRRDGVPIEVCSALGSRSGEDPIARSHGRVEYVVMRPILFARHGETESNPVPG